MDSGRRILREKLPVDNPKYWRAISILATHLLAAIRRYQLDNHQIKKEAGTSPASFAVLT